MLCIREAVMLICLSEVLLGAREPSLDLRAEPVWEAVSVAGRRKLDTHSSQEAVPQRSRNPRVLRPGQAQKLLPLLSQYELLAL